MNYELDGFAEDESVVDGNFEAFNYCLAQEYLGAIYSEDFEALGDMDRTLIDNIVHWLNYDGKIGKDDIEDIKGIADGTIITCKNRTFIEAICEYHNWQLAETYISRGIMDTKLYLICLIYGENEKGLLNSFHYFVYNKEKYLQFLDDIFNNIDLEYKKIIDIEEKKQFLLKMYDILKAITYPEEYGKINIKTENYSWMKQYIKNNNVKK